MLEIVYFTLIAVALYFASDWILNRIELARGKRFAYRDIVFFLLILALALIVFQAISLLGLRASP